MQRPLLSFVLFCYNQESFIRQALESALSQTYSPMEIIVADDCSTDRSFEVIQSVASTYQGPHALHLMRHPQNLGIAGNLNRAIENCTGDLLILAAGDDISLPERAEVIYRAWEASGRRALGLYSCYTMISGDGSENGIGGTRVGANDPQKFQRLDGDLCSFLSTRNPMVNGCSAAWSSHLFKYFGPVDSGLEDVVLSFRTLALGELHYIHQPLIRWRRHGDNVSFLAGEVVESFERRERRLRWVDEMTVRAFDNMLADIDLLSKRSRISPGERDRLRAEARRVQAVYRLERAMMDGSMLARCTKLLAAATRGDWRGALRSAPRALPLPVYRALYTFRAGWRASLM